MVALAGAGPWPQITSVRPRLTSCTITGTSPPGPLRCGSTTCSVKAVATPASNAAPPFSSVAMPTAVAIQWVEVTTPNVPPIPARVVNGSGLILPIFVRLFWCAGDGADRQLSTAGLACQLPVSKGMLLERAPTPAFPRKRERGPSAFAARDVRHRGAFSDPCRLLTPP